VVAAGLTTTLHVRLRPPRPPNGRVEMLLGSTVAGMVAGSILCGTLIDGDNWGTGAVACAAGGGIGGFLLPYYKGPRHVPVGTTSFVLGASVWGAIEGAAVASAADASQDTGILVALGGSVLFSGTAALSASRLGLSGGDAALINSGGVWGVISSLLIAGGFGGGLDTETMLLGGVNIGLIGGALFARQYEISRGHAAAIDLGGLAGLLSGVAVSLLFTSDTSNDAQVANFGLAGSILGLVTGALLTRSMDIEAETTPTISVVEDPAGNKVTAFGFAGRF
jgi:hypothetical protein